ncbi:DegT/DnrJ/EryC1/StrS family aminotransferase [Kitasatospora sp. NPDC048194]|uniref:DegT/DnrJ/EryC1/StrS family aminotransferase n=1 Tax=Kitasatospora sp. NPDC048194 TaxID=3364045 RepID=UPI00371BC6FC
MTAPAASRPEPSDRHTPHRPSARSALLGGAPVRSRPLPSVFDATGRLFGPEEREAVDEVLRSGTLTRWGGTAVTALERAWADRLGVRHAVAVSSGTAALQVALAALDLAPGREVVTTPVTDMGTVIAIVRAQLVPVFADVDPLTGMLTPETVRAAITEHTGAVLPVHLFGRLAPTAGIRAVTAEFGVPVVEDASQAHFSRDRDGFAGTGGAFGCFSLQQSKVISCGEGGILVTDDDELFERAALFQNKGWARERTGDRAYPVLGVNYRMPELSAAVALAQLRKADEIIARRRNSHAALVVALAGEPDVRVATERDGELASWWALCVQWPALLAEPGLGAGIAASLAADGTPFAPGYIGVSPLYLSDALRAVRPGEPPWSFHPRPPRHRPGDCPGAERFLRHSFTLNWNEGLTPDDARDVARAVARALPAARAQRDRGARGPEATPC